MVKLLAPLLFSMSILAPAAHADSSGDALPLAVLRIDAAVAAKCLPRLNSPDSLIKAHKIKWVQGEPNSKAVVGGLLQEIDRLHGGIFMPFSNFAVDVNLENDIAGRQVYDNKLNMARIVVAEPENVALFIHEMGHVLGNSAFTPVKAEFAATNRSQTWYGAYNSFVTKPCNHTQYSKSGSPRRNEEFAEVVSAFFTRPQLLKNGSAQCRMAYEFLRTRAFPNGEPKCLPVVAPVLPPKPAPTTPAPPSTPVTPSQPATPTTPPVAAPTTPPIIRDEIVCTENREDTLTVRNEDLDDFLYSLARGESVVRDESAGKKQREVDGKKLDYVYIRFADGEGDGWVAETYIRERKLCPGAPAAPEKMAPIDEHEEPSQPVSPTAPMGKPEFPESPAAPAGFGGDE